MAITSLDLEVRDCPDCRLEGGQSTVEDIVWSVKNGMKFDIGVSGIPPIELWSDYVCCKKHEGLLEELLSRTSTEGRENTCLGTH